VSSDRGEARPDLSPHAAGRPLEAIERKHKPFNSAARTKSLALAGKERPRRAHHHLRGLVTKGRAEEAAVLLAGHIRGAQRSIRAKARGR
jgi:hypothetical protein